MNLFRLFLSLMIAVHVSQLLAMHKPKIKKAVSIDRFELIELIVVSKDDRSPLTLAEQYDLNICDGYTICMVQDYREQFARPPFLQNKKDVPASATLLRDGIATLEKDIK